MTSQEEIANVFDQTYSLYINNINSDPKFARMFEVMNQVYGDRWDIRYHSIFNTRKEVFLNEIKNSSGLAPSYWFSSKLQKADDSFFSFIIYYPSITITNDRGLSRKLDDFYVRLAVTHDGKVINELRGLRTTVAIEEYAAFYFHSHLSSFNPNSVQFIKFCVGTGPISQVITAFNTNPFDEVSFAMILHTLNTYLEYESLEGGPYKKMEQLGGAENRRDVLTDYTIKNCYENCIRHFREEHIEKVANMDCVRWNGESFSIESNVEFEKLITAILLRQGFSNLNSDYFVIRKENGDSLPAKNNLIDVVYQKTPVLEFKGEEKFFKVTKNENNENLRNRVYPDPRITQYFGEKLSKQLNKNLTAYCRALQGSTNSTVTGVHG